MKPRTHTTDDGTQITYRVIDDKGEGDWLVFLGGLGGTYLVWAPLAKALRGKHSILIWDYPGLSAGSELADESEVSIKQLASYQVMIMDREKIDRACLVGWSLGPQVSLEVAKNHQDRMSAMVAICGVAGEPFADDHEEEPIAAALGLRSAVPSAVGWISDRADRIEKLRAMLRRIERPTRWATRLGFVDPVVDEIVFNAVIRDFIAMNPTTYRRYLHAAAEHDATEILADLKVPMLVMAGERDRLIHPSRAREMAESVTGAEHFEVRGGTHFVPLEYPELLALKIEDFLSRRTSP